MMYFRYMLAAFVTNGIGAFGLRILAGRGVAGIYQLQYLCLWYLAGCMLASVAYFLTDRRPCLRELLIGGAMAVCSFLGQIGMMLALAKSIPGFVVYPVATGGGLLFVVIVGVVFFRERVSHAGYLGLGLGVVALILLALP